MSASIIDIVAFLLARPKLPGFYDSRENTGKEAHSLTAVEKNGVNTSHTAHSSAHTANASERRGRWLPPSCHSQWTTNTLDVLVTGLSAIRLLISADQTAQTVSQKFTW